MPFGVSSTIGVSFDRYQLDVVPVERGVVAAVAQGALGVEVGRGELAGRLRVLDDLGDLAADKRCGSFVGVPVRGDVAEGVEHEAEAAAGLPGLLEDGLAFLFGDAHGRNGAFLEPEGDAGTPDLFPDLAVVLLDGCNVLRRDSGVADRDAVLRGALEDGEVSDLGCDGGDDLQAGGAGADDADALAGQVHAFGPGAGVVDLALERVDARDIGDVGGGEQAEAVDEVLRRDGFAGVRADDPAVG